MKTRFLKYTFLLAAFLWSVAVIAQSEISIQTHPHYESACAGSATSFTVAATGGNLSYQWYGFTGQGVEALNDGGIYSGTNTPTLQISEVSVEMNKRYFFCKISNDSQETRTTSATIRLKNLLINNQPRDRSVYAGDNAIFRMDASGDNIKFQWQRKQDGVFTNLTDGKSYNGVDLSVLIVKEVEAADNASEFRCVVTGGDACLAGSLTTESAVLNVKEGLNPVKSMSLLPAETVLTLDNEIVTFSNGTEVTVWGSVVVQGDNGQFSYHNTTNSDKPELEITGSLTNNNIADELFQEDDETIVTFSGSTDESILGSGLANNFHTLIINKTSGASLSLDNTPSGTINQAASVEYDLTFSAGKLNLKNNNLELLPFNSQNLALLDNTNFNAMPFILNETNDNRIIADDGEVFMEVLVGSTNPIDEFSYDLGNMGLRLEGLQDGVSQFSGDNLTIRRGHNSYGINSGTIDRYFKVISGAGTPDVRMTMTYFSDELGSLDFSALDFYRNEDLNAGAAWQNQGNSDTSPSTGVRTLEGELPVAGLWTLSPCNNAPDVDFPGLGEFNMCFGDNPITLNPSISGTPVNYLWELGFYNQTTFEIDYTIISGATGSTYDVNHNNTVGGVTEYYRLTVSDASGCKGQGFASVTHVPEITVDWSNEPTVQCDLGVYFISGYWNYDNAFYTWSVDNVQQAETSSLFSFTPPAAGTYEISLTTGYFSEGEICPETFTHTISFNDQPLSFSFPYEFEEVRLCGDEQVTLTPENITPSDDGSYTYEWFTEDDPETILSNSPTLTVGEGTPYGDEQYLLRITTGIGCFDLQLVTVYTTPVANLDWSTLPAIQCDLSPYTIDADWGYEFAVYQWSVDNVLQASETGAQFNFTPPAAGTYEISVTTGEDDFNGGIACPTTYTHTITFSEEPVNVSFPYLFSEVDVCEAEGSFTLTPDLTPADDGSYTYSWTLGGVEVGTDPTYAVTFDVAIESEIYQLTVTTGVGCTDNESVLVYHTESADVDWSALPETVCTLDPYTFDADWGNVGAGFQWNVDDEIQTGEIASTFVFTPPAAGTYTISVITGEYGSIQYCPEQFTHTITFSDGQQLANLPFSISACDIEGGVTPIDLETPACTDCAYQWLDANDNPVGTNSNTYTVPDLTQNTSYSVEVTKDGCTSTDAVSLFYNFTMIDEAATIITGIDCDGGPTGAIDLVYDTNDFGYHVFSWENVNTGETYDNEDLTGLAAGTYSVTITDNLNGCIDTATFVVGGGGESVTATSVVVQPSCFGDDNGSITLTPSGGTGTYTYAWSHGPTTIAVTDLSPDAYTVTISDGNDCEYTENFNIVEPVVLAIGLEKTDLNCAGGADGTITVTTTGGTEPYSYVWSPNANNPTDPENLTGLSAGTYIVTVTDDRNCTATTGITIEEPTNAITASFAPTTEGISCNNANDGIISINASGGTGDLTYDWNADIYDGMSEVNNLPPGMYSISVSDENGCPPVVLEITFDNPVSLTVSDVTVNPTAAGTSDGSIDITVAGGTPDYNYDWVDVPGLNNDEDRTGLGAGTYTVVITDENGCEVTAQYQLTAPGELSVTLVSTTDIPCTEAAEGAIDITVNGGVMPYQYLWSNGAMTEDLMGVPAGDYTVMITDDNGIEFNSITYTVNPPVFLMDNASVTQINCAGETGMIVLNPTGGTSEYNYAWSNEMTTATITGLPAGDYTVTITTENDCPLTETYTINPAPIAITAAFDNEITTDISCNGAADGAILVNASGGTGTLTYDWNVNSLDGSNEHGNLSEGIYIVSVSDENGCPPVVLEITLNNPTAITVTDVLTNPTSVGGIDGAIDLTTLGGTPGYTFEWADLSGLEQPEDRTDLTAGTYTVTITDSNGCSITEEYMLTEPGQISLVLESITDVSCEGTDDGAIDITPSGGVEPYTILWSNGAMTEDLMNVPAGDYTVMITDDNGIIFNSITYTVNPPVFLTDNASITQINCAGETGTIVLSPTGGTSTYAYMWSHGPTTATVTDLAAGDYTVTISTENDCPFTATYTIDAAPTAITAAFDATTSNISCNNLNDGFILINASGGTGMLTYDWNIDTYDGMNEASSLLAGVYSISITDENNCSPVVLEIIIENPEAITASEMIINPTTAGALDGEIDLTVSGGTPDFNFDWDDLAGTDNAEDRTGLAAGNYIVTITDANGCTFTEQYTLTAPGQISIVLESITDVSCEGTDDGAIDITPSGGVEPYTILWSNGDETEDLSNVPAGDYTVMITDDNGIEFNSLTYTVNPPNFLVDNAIITQIDCSDETGIIALSPTNGTGDYTYAWAHGPTTATVSDLAAGDYTVTISTDNDCPFVGTYTINAAPTEISVTGSASGVCAGSADGTIEIDVTGGTPDYSFIWTNTADNSTVALTEDVMNLPAGNYQVEVTDANSCVAVFDFNIPEYPALAGTAEVMNVTAAGVTDGAIDLTITGGTEEFTFAWSDGDVFMADTEDISDLSVGTYTVLVTDANGCTFTASYTVNEPGALDIALNIIQDIACFGEETGQITATIGGGTEPYTFAWSNGGSTNPLIDLPAGTYTLTATDDAGIVTVSNPITIGEPTEFTINAQVTNPTTVGGNDGSILTAPSGGESPYTFNWSDGTDIYSTSSLNDIGAGNYDLTVTDANGCVATDALTTYTLTDPNVLSITLTASQNVSCPEGADGSLTVNASGGVEEYTYNWENAANPGTSIGATATIDALEAGTYNVTATDADGLMTSSSFDITQPEALVYNELINNVLCDNPMSGSITLVPTGGTGIHTYLWSNEATTASITDLIAGDYSVTITDENDCTYSETFTVVPASLISAIETTIDVNCNGDNTGSINLAPQGGGGTYTYLWSNEATTQNISQLTAGEYSVTISDGGECEFIETYTIDEPTALTASTTTMQASQPTTADGSIDLTVMGGTEPYSFFWSNEEITEDLENILPGTYSVTITDDNECEFTETVSVTSPGGMSVIPTATQITCFGLDNGSISLEIEGGTMPFTILWSNDETTETISDLEAGVYTVTVTDDTGFSINTSAEITEPAEFSLVATPMGVACNGDENGSINITTNNGQSPFDFVWSNEALTQNISDLASGVYMVTATDDNGCETTQTATVATPSVLALTVDVIENPECWDETNGTIFLSTTGGTGDYEYIWSNSETTEDIINLSPDTYFVTVTDENNCTAEMSYEVTAPLPLLITFDETNITCGGATVGSITATVTGGTSATGDYNLMWSNGETSLTINDLMAGDYTLTAEDDNGCTSVESATITQTGSLVLSETQENISCFGEEDGLILVQVVDSGTAPFDYLWSNGEMTDLVTGLAAQDYTVTITDAEGCEGVETYFISQPTPIVGALDAIPASCFDSENGAIEVTVSGGTLDAGNTYAYLWSNAETTEDLGNLSGGEYTVTITDDNDCQLIETETVLSPDEIVIIAVQGGTDCGNTDNISIALEVTGGTPDYIYNWDNGATTSIVENLAEGTYMATVTDDNGCTQSIEQSVSQPTPIAADAFIQRAGCKTENDGLIDVTTTGGLAPYDFAWSNGSFEEDILGLSAGSYSLTVTDATNCVHEMNFEIEIAPEPFAVNFLVNSGLSETDTLQVNSSDIVQFIDVTLPTPTAWEWSFGDANNSTSTEQNPQFSYPFDEDMEQTEYMASLVASNEFCRDTITKTILIINNFRPNLPTFDPGENVRFLDVNAYPNPTDDVINLDIEMSKDAEVKVQIVDVLGRIHEERILTEDDTYSTQFSLKNLTNGVYYLHLSSADRKVTLGVVKVD